MDLVRNLSDYNAADRDRTACVFEKNAEGAVCRTLDRRDRSSPAVPNEVWGWCLESGHAAAEGLVGNRVCEVGSIHFRRSPAKAVTRT